MIDNQYISIDPNIAFGKPCIAGTRISVEFILEQLALGHAIDNLLDGYPQLTREQVVAVLNFARERIRNDLHGIPMTEEAFERLISDEIPYRYEFIDQVVYDMTGSSPEHSEIAGNIFSLIYAYINRKGPCKVYRNQYVAIPGKPPVVADMVLTCDRADWDKDKRLEPFRVRSPRIVIEVLSPSTENYNRTEKFARYQRCSSLEVYILVSQDEPHVEVYRRATKWRQERISAGQTIKLDQIGLDLPLDTIYEGVL